MNKLLTALFAIGFLAGEAHAQQSLGALKKCNSFATLQMIQQIDAKEVQANNIYLKTIVPELAAIERMDASAKGPRCAQLKPQVENWSAIARSILPLLQKAVPAMQDAEGSSNGQPGPCTSELNDDFREITRGIPALEGRFNRACASEPAPQPGGGGGR